MRFHELFEEQSQQPTVGWHVTTEDAFEDIKYVGYMEPRTADTKYSFADKPVIFLVTNPNELQTAYRWVSYKSRDDQPLTTLKIDLRGINLIEYNGFWCATENIPLSRITNIGDVEVIR